MCYCDRQFSIENIAACAIVHRFQYISVLFFFFSLKDTYFMQRLGFWRSLYLNQYLFIQLYFSILQFLAQVHIFQHILMWNNFNFHTNLPILGAKIEFLFKIYPTFWLK